MRSEWCTREPLLPGALVQQRMVTGAQEVATSSGTESTVQFWQISDVVAGNTGWCAGLRSNGSAGECSRSPDSCIHLTASVVPCEAA